ncbi:MAG: hypothetical protein H0Z32_11105 [Bacillaceae bacterium]|nr:hypothetical protein [Bacillaceae bacterium]
MEENKLLYFYVLLGVMGPVLILLSAFKTNIIQDDPYGFLMLSFGFMMSLSYIDYLEKRAELSHNLVWFRRILSITLFLGIGYFLFS